MATAKIASIKQTNVQVAPEARQRSPKKYKLQYVVRIECFK